MKVKRQQKIIELIKNNNIDTQASLMEYLNESGFSATQATLSRDIRELRLAKVLGTDGVYKYALPEKKENAELSDKFRSIFSEAVMSVDYAFHIVVIKCHTGMANAACAALDNMGFDDIVGSLAGDDTIFVLLRSEQEALRLVNEIKENIK